MVEIINPNLLREALPFLQYLGSAVIAFGCGYLARPIKNDWGTEVHDHDRYGRSGPKRLGWVDDADRKEGWRAGDLYDETIHGPIRDWLDEGAQLTTVNGKPMVSSANKPAIHRHGGGSASGSHEYEYESR